MKKEYNSPEACVVEFDTKDVITTSPAGAHSVIMTFSPEVANEEAGWTGLY